MLRLVNIKKDYKIADGKVEALKGINLTFRKNEFVSILGPSGCGKTTLLNIVGGLGHYTSGDLFINGVSTKNFSDREWDVYRNHRVGFVFQSYNLIPHQTVLSNVELALTIAGISKEERVLKAKKALDKVGLSDQYYKKPNQLSGGQSQRVAIARALVNDPEILLADEPTGALDTKTSKQIMELIKEIAKDKLVIMVTHNPELAEEYSTRIVNLLDGELQSDSNPVSNDDKDEEKRVSLKDEKAKMSWWTTFKLSLQNLISKKSRTILTSVASSIGIIGISLVLALSYGLQTYIGKMQEDMLSGNPITISSSSFDFSSFADGMDTGDKISLIKENGYVTISGMIEEIALRASQSESMIIENDINQTYVDYVNNMPEELRAAIFLDYEIKMKNNVYTDYYLNSNQLPENISLSALETIYREILKQNEATEPYASILSSFTKDFVQAPNNEEYLNSQYDILEGKIATNENEIMLVVNKDHLITDLLLSQLGYYTQEEFINIVFKVAGDDRYDESLDKDKISYEELMGKTFTWYTNDTVFNKETGNPLSPFTYNAYSKDFTTINDAGIELEIVGILEPKENISYGSLSSGFYYTEALTKRVLTENMNSEIVEYLESVERDSIASGYQVVGENKTAYGITYNYSYSFLGEEFNNQIGFVGEVDMMLSMLGSFGVTTEDVYLINKNELGGNDLASIISIYNYDLEQKEAALKYLDAWNEDGNIIVNGTTLTPDNRSQIIYSDLLTLIFALISGVINVITIALIGFTTLSLVVSCVMIAIITYVSVVERINEIGVIRSLGGRKRDVSNLFVAETAIIGFISGIIAILFTYFASFIINLIVVGSLGSQIAIFPLHFAIIMVVISVLLTLVSGFIPSRSAAKKDPADALRAE
ncbi:MAG TPA: ABC transporter ATP-binding protein/permease [Acholeplasmataceae bacterium]|nr:ABC transporter ATP-binding protein/permease [Acholeplasmataceae bacterium]